MLALGGITGAYIAKACQFQAIKMIDVSRTTAVLPLESLFVVLLSYFIFHEIPSVIKLLGGAAIITGVIFLRSEEHTSELQSLMRISYAVFCLKKKKSININ